MQQNTFANFMLLDVRTAEEFNKSHIDQSHHLKFAHFLPSKNKKHKSDSNEHILYKKWLKQIVKLHQSSFSKSKIKFFIVHNDDNAMGLIQNVCNWLNHLYHDKHDNIPQIDTSQYFYLSFTEYKKQFDFMCSDHLRYEEGRLFPSKITENIFLSNWGIGILFCL